MNTGELLKLAEGVPWAATGVIATAVASYALERLTGLAGPVSRAANWWRERELRKLRWEVRLRAERRRIEQEEEGARLAALREEVAWLKAEVARLRTMVCTCVEPPTRNLPRVPAPRR